MPYEEKASYPVVIWLPECLKCGMPAFECPCPPEAPKLNHFDDWPEPVEPKPVSPERVAALNSWYPYWCELTGHCKREKLQLCQQWRRRGSRSTSPRSSGRRSSRSPAPKAPLHRR